MLNAANKLPLVSCSQSAAASKNSSEPFSISLFCTSPVADGLNHPGESHNP